MRKFATLAAVAALTSAPHLAFAADLGAGGMKDAPPPVMITNWSGFYAGVGIGFGAMQTDYNVYDINRTYPGGLVNYSDRFRRNIGGEGVLGTVQLGYDYQFPATRWLIGAFIDYDWENMSGSNYEEHRSSLFGTIRPTLTSKVSLEDQWTVGGRVGFLTSPDLLVYGVLGYTQAQVKAWTYGDVTPFLDPDNGLPIPGLSGTATLDGIMVGAGFETHLKDNWFLKLEYRYSQFGGERAWDLFRVDSGNATSSNLWGDVSTDVHTARLAITYKIGRQGVVDPLR